ncbi:unnamed protein product [Coffea canephora]|uniref:Disease resistance N-terminal domain-containing protein n=1 Tax=Coffea canephora TaxID=49390 RepID=A0A068UVS2_COFCA|nr:unnamed protein product [Coffea canephora]
MADLVISPVIDRTGDLLIQNFAFLKDVRRQVERLQNDLVWMRCFLKDADQRQDEDERIRNRVSDIRAAAYDVEDVIEIFTKGQHKRQGIRHQIGLAHWEPLQDR